MSHQRIRHLVPQLVPLVIALLLLIGLSGCIQNLGREPGWGKPTTLEFEVQEDVAIPDRSVVCFYGDGLHKPTFDKMLAAGELPHIKKYLVDRGVTVENAVTPFPTITHSIFASYATGRLPGHNGILGNKWFDPLLLINQDYTQIATLRQVDDGIIGPTLYELLDRERSCVVLNQANRGCTVFYENWMVSGIAWFFEMFRNINMSTTARLQNAADLANQTKRWPDLITLYYPSTDEVGHRYGPQSEQYRQMLRYFDDEVGDACKAFEKEGLLERMMLILTSDHGLTFTPEHSNLSGAMEKVGYRVFSSKLTPFENDYKERYDRLKDYDAVATCDGDRFAKLYVHMPDSSWAYRPTLAELERFPAPRRGGAGLRGEVKEHQDGRPGGAAGASGIAGAGGPGSTVNLVELCLDLPATHFVAHSDRCPRETRVTIISHGGRSVITRRQFDGQKSYRYEPLDGHDPFGYLGDPPAAALIDGRFHTADEWFKASYRSEFPYFVPQFPELFDSVRAGDLCLFAKRGWNYGTNLAGHGGLEREETVVPLIFAGQSLPRGVAVPYGQTLSLAPTIAHFIRGGQDPAIFSNFDADSLLDILRAAGQNVQSGSPSGSAP